MNKQSAGFPISDQNGFSLITVLVSFGLSATVMMFSAAAFVNLSKNEQYIRNHSAFEAIHLLGIQKARNTALLKAYLQQNSPSLYDCFLRSGSNCREFHQKKILLESYPDSKINLTESFSDNGAACSNNCSVKRSAYAEAECADQFKCERLKITIQTVSAENSIAAAREATSEFYQNINDFSARGNLDFSCADSGSFISEIDFASMKAYCKGFSDSDGVCSSGKPLSSFGSLTPSKCWSTVDNSCGNGFSALSLSKNSTACATASN